MSAGNGDGMGKALIVGAGGVAQVAAHKCAQIPEVFGEIVLASRTLGKCERIRDRIERKYGRRITVDEVNADDVAAMTACIRRHNPDLVLHLALPYQDISIMKACLETNTPYVDTANYETPDNPQFEYKEQWKLHEEFKQKGLLALLGSGFDPGVTNVFCAHAQKEHFESIRLIDILDCNAGDHGHPFATNFNPEINIREITQPGRYWEKGEWKQVDPLSVKMVWDYPTIGPRDSYLLYHEELESLAQNIRGLERIRFFMTFGASYLRHLEVLQNLGMTSIEPVMYEGHPVIPLKFLQLLLPDPASIGENYVGKTNIGCWITGKKRGEDSEQTLYIYNICEHRAAYEETGAQAVSYTTGVPAMIGAMLVMNGTWQGAGVFNIEQFDPTPFMDALNQHGLPWKEEWPTESREVEERG